MLQFGCHCLGCSDGSRAASRSSVQSRTCLFKARNPQGDRIKKSPVFTRHSVQKKVVRIVLSVLEILKLSTLCFGTEIFYKNAEDTFSRIKPINSVRAKRRD